MEPTIERIIYQLTYHPDEPMLFRWAALWPLTL